MKKTEPSKISGDALLARLSASDPEGRYPLKCQWEITCRCNLHCVMCYTDCQNTAAEIRRELSRDQILRILAEMREAGVLEIHFTGGEPLARPDFREIYRRAVEQGFLVKVFTNGTLIDEAWIALWKERPPVAVEISFHSLRPEVFDAIAAHPGAFTKVRGAIQRLKEEGLPMVLKALALTLNRGELLLLKDFASQWGAGFRLGTSLRPAVNGNASVLEYELPEPELGAVLAQDPELAKEDCFFKEAEKTLGCHEGRRQFHIDAYGCLQLCSNNRRGRYDLTRGTFREGFYGALPGFPCPRKRLISGTHSFRDRPTMISQGLSPLKSVPDLSPRATRPLFPGGSDG